MLMNHVIEHLSEKLFVSKQKIFTIGHIVNVDEAQLKLYELDNEIVVVPSDTKVNRVVPSEKLRHVTLVYQRSEINSSRSPLSSPTRTKTTKLSFATEDTPKRGNLLGTPILQTAGAKKT